MDIKQITKEFARMGARAKLGPFQPRRWETMTGRVRIDILRDGRGEYFDIRTNSDRMPDLRVADVQPRDRHLLLIDNDAKFLCGHDERHWFVAAVPETAAASSVLQAKEALMPDAVREALGSKRVKRRHRHRRKNDAFLRQGEWFFIPDPDFRINEHLVLLSEPLVRGRGKPHMTQYLYRSGGETVYVSRVARDGMTETQFQAWARNNATRRDVRWTIMRRDPVVHVRGKIRHPDHKTIDLRDWHRVEMNTETKAKAMEHVVFMD